MSETNQENVVQAEETPALAEAISPEELKKEQARLIKGSMDATAKCKELLQTGMFVGTKAIDVANCIRFLEALHDQQKAHLKQIKAK